MFSEVRNALMYEWRGVHLNSNIDVWNRLGKSPGTHFAGYVSPMGWLGVPIVGREDKSGYIQRLEALGNSADDPRG